MSEQRTEKATPQRKKKAAESGDRVRSRELVQAFTMLAGLGSFALAAKGFPLVWRTCFERCLLASSRGERTGDQPLWTLLRYALLPALKPAGLVLAACLCAALAAGLAQSGGLQLSASALQPKLERLNPATHVKQLFSLRTATRLCKSLLPALALVWFAWKEIAIIAVPMPVLSTARMPQAFASAYSVGIKAAWIMVAWSALDYAVEWRSWSQRLRMSKQEVREEIKESMGNPQVKGKIRQIQRLMRKRRAKVDMRRATVVITNPTHYAVALEFSFETMQAPTVLTKGRDLHALDIREEARWANIPIIENPPLARSLYRSVEIGQSIPYELYAAVAGILAFLFRQQQEEAARNRRDAQQGHASRGYSPGMAGFQGGM